MIWQDRTRTDPTKRKFIDENGNEQNVNIEEIQSNITQSGTPVNATTMNNIEKNLGTYGNDSYDSTATYLEGETVTHNALLYRAKQDIETPEEWTAEHWEQTSALQELANTSGNEIAIGTEEDITRQTKALIKRGNYKYINSEIAIGSSNNDNRPVWFKKSKNLFVPTLYNNGTKIAWHDCNATLNGDEYTFVATGTDLYFGQITGENVAYSNDKGTLYSVTPGETIKVLVTNTDFNFILITRYTSEKVSMSYVVQQGNTATYVIPENCYYITIRIGKNNAVSGTTYKTKVMLAKGTGDITYEDYMTPSIIADNTEFYSQENIEHYSLDEQKIGKWIDGKPIYRITFPMGALPASTSTSKQKDVAYLNPDTITNIYGVAWNTNGTTTPLPSSGVAGGSIGCDLYCWSNGTNYILTIFAHGDLSSFNTSYVTMEYTKTTD